MLGAVHWEQTSWGAALGGQEAAVFFIVLIIYLVCLTVTLTSFREMPLREMQAEKSQARPHRESVFEPGCDGENNFGGPHNPRASIGNGNFLENETYSDTAPLHGAEALEKPVTLQDYLWSIIHMPSSLRVLCLTNLCCWMSLVCYSLYFTDFVGQSVFGGDPTATRHSNSEGRRLYEEGVRFGCWGMAVYSISCSVYSAVIERLIFRLGKFIHHPSTGREANPTSIEPE
jgi:solute carrier family 45, member 1/2/4